MDALAETTTPYVSKYPPRDASKPKRKRIDLALAGVLLAQGLDYDEIAPQVNAATGNCLRVTMARHGLTKSNVRNPRPEASAQATVTAKIVSAADSILRDRLNTGLSASIEALTSKKPTYKSLASRGQGHAATLKQLAETWRTLNGNPDSITVQFGANLLSDFTPTPPPVVSGVPVIDVSEATTIQPVQQPDSV